MTAVDRNDFSIAPSLAHQEKKLEWATPNVTAMTMPDNEGKAYSGSENGIYAYLYGPS